MTDKKSEKSKERDDELWGLPELQLPQTRDEITGERHNSHCNSVLLYSSVFWSCLLWSCLVWSGLVCSALLCLGLVSSALLWSCLVWSGLVCSALLCLGLLKFDSSLVLVWSVTNLWYSVCDRHGTIPSQHEICRTSTLHLSPVFTCGCGCRPVYGVPQTLNKLVFALINYLFVWLNWIVPLVGLSSSCVWALFWVIIPSSIRG